MSGLASPPVEAQARKKPASATNIPAKPCFFAERRICHMNSMVHINTAVTWTARRIGESPRAASTTTMRTLKGTM